MQILVSKLSFFAHKHICTHTHANVQRHPVSHYNNHKYWYDRRFGSVACGYKQRLLTTFRAANAVAAATLMTTTATTKTTKTAN